MKNLLQWLRQVFQQEGSQEKYVEQFSVEYYPITERYYPKYGIDYLRTKPSTGIINTLEPYFFDYADFGKTESEANQIIRKFKEQSLKQNVITTYPQVQITEKEFEVKRFKNHRGHSHLVVIIEPAIEDIHIGTVLIVPYAEGFIDPARVRLQVDENGLPKRANGKFAIVLEYIFNDQINTNATL